MFKKVKDLYWDHPMVKLRSTLNLALGALLSRFAGPFHSFLRLQVFLRGDGWRSYLAVCSTKTQTPIPFNSSSVLILSTKMSVSVVYFITFGCEGEDVNKILTRIPSRGRLDLERNTLIFCLETGYSQ